MTDTQYSIPADRRPEFVPEELGSKPEPRGPRNPWIRALVFIWIGGFALTFVMLFGAVGVQNPGTQDSPAWNYSPSEVTSLLVLAAVCAAIGLIALMAHIAVRAVTWRAP